jgi:hypothetical protein
MIVAVHVLKPWRCSFMNTLKNVVKKAVSLGAGSLLLGTTLVAAELSQYPAPFVNNGQFDGLIVVGERAASQDIIGAIDIASSLQAASVTPVGTGGSSKTVLTGDVVQIGQSGDILEIGEFMGDVTETLSDEDLEMLRSGSITTQVGTTDFTQTLDLDVAATGDSGKVVLDENDDRETGLYLLFEDGSPVFTYELEFTSGLESDVESSEAVDLEDEAIFMLGQYYTVVDSTIGTNSVALELIAGDVTDTLSVRESKTYTVDGEEYEVSVLVVGNNGADVKFLVNGEVTDSMSDGDTDTLADGLEIGVREIIETERNLEDDPSSLVEFYLGANKIEITDATTTTAGTGNVEINRENIEDLDADIDATSSATDLRINSISFTLNVDAVSGENDVFLTAGDGLRAHLDEPEGMLAAGWDIVFEGVSEPDTTPIEFVAQGDDEYQLRFTNRRGDELSVPYAINTGGTTSKFGDETDDFVFYESYQDVIANTLVDAGTFTISDEDYFLITDDDQDNLGDSYVLQWTDIDHDDKTLTFTNVASGADIEVSFDVSKSINAAANAANGGAVSAANATGDITIGGKDFSFWLRNVTGTYTLAVDQDNDGLLTSVFVANAGDGAADDVDELTNVVVRGGGLLGLSDAVGGPAGGTWNISLTTLAEDLDTAEQQVQTATFTESANELDVGGLDNQSGTFFEQAVNDEDKTVAINRYGTWFEITEEDEDADDLVINYPTEQVEALVYVVGGEVQSSMAAGGSSGARVNPISVGTAVLDSDVTYDQDNMIVVGGPCVNTIAAQLLGNPADCAEGFTQGHAMIKMFDTGRNQALLVAGFSAQDTVGASRVLAEYNDYDLSGMEMDVTVSSLNNIRVTERN